MQITNNKTTVQLNEQKILDLIIDRRIAVIEKVVKNYYEVSKVTELTKRQFNVLMYLCVELWYKTLKERELLALITDVFEVTDTEIMKSSLLIYSECKQNKQLNNEVYKLSISCRQQLNPELFKTA